jgi:two-component system, chemotaxis family, CheB/CheR fusion protein
MSGSRHPAIPPAPDYLVAVGSSSGGLLALRSILGDLECRGLSAYVLAHHLSPDEETQLPEILAPHTPLTVEIAATGEPLRPDHLYICPAGQDLEIRNGRLFLIEPESSAPIAPSIDRLFRSVAQTFGEQAVGLILSGTGQDGREGCALILAAGGQLIVQSPAEASAPAMPNAALAACGEALCGDSQEIVRWLNRIETLCEQPRARTPTDRLFAELIARVAQVTGLSLGRYKEGTLRRQTARHYQALGFDSLETYFEHVQDDPEQLRQLQRRFLISVSRFFRDPEVFGALEQALRHLLAHKTEGDTIRVWIPACASGEEAYSILILLHEILGERLEDFEVRVFATDLDQEALDAARAGLYPAEALSQLDTMRRERWFSQQGSLWRLDKTLRELCVFCIHDLLAHPPFLNMDLISCRNLLIYVRPEQQAELFATFHYALRPSGLLLLGQSESVGASSNLFEPIDIPHKLYRRRDSIVSRPPRLARYQPPIPLGYRFPAKSRSQGTPNPLRDAALDELVRAYNLLGGAGQYQLRAIAVLRTRQTLFRAAGRYQRLLDLLALSARAAHRTQGAWVSPPAGAGRCPARHRHAVRIGDQRDADTPGGAPCQAAQRGADPGVSDRLRGVASRPLGRGDRGGERGREREDDEITRLRQELAETREYLQSILDQREIAHEEIQSLQEEIQVSTEELQTANEELQSSNEELTTLNDELRLKTNEATELSTTLANIQNSIRTALIVVDRDGRITASTRSRCVSSASSTTTSATISPGSPAISHSPICLTVWSASSARASR